MGSVKLEAKDLTKRYARRGRKGTKKFDAVSSANLVLQSGELVVLKGRSGSGKSTLLNMMAGLLAPTKGFVTLDGQDLYALTDQELSQLRNERIGVIPQGQTALHALSVAENVALPCLMYHPDSGDVEPRVLELLDSVGIRELAHSYPSELSGGEMRRMSIARSLICKPDVIMADEPTSDLDDENTAAVLQMLRKIADDGTAVLLVTHEQSAEAYGDRVLRMDAGHLEV